MVRNMHTGNHSGPEKILIRKTGLSEEQISELFSSAGRVLNFRLVYDRETGRPKGFGFAEFPDPGR